MRARETSESSRRSDVIATLPIYPSTIATREPRHTPYSFKCRDRFESHSIPAHHISPSQRRLHVCRLNASLDRSFDLPICQFARRNGSGPCTRSPLRSVWMRLGVPVHIVTRSSPPVNPLWLQLHSNCFPASSTKVGQYLVILQ